VIDEDLQRWTAHPVLGAALQAVLVAIPVGLGIGVGIVVRRTLGDAAVFGVPPWIVAGVVGMVVVWVVQPVARRLTPLSWLLKVGLLFPDRAPSRIAIARQAGRLQQLEERLATSTTDTSEQAAQWSAELILSLVTALTAHDRRTRGHAERTRVFTDLLSEELGLSQHDRDRLRWASLLHDIGKLEVSQRLLNKPGRPTAQEWEQLRRHPEAGDLMVAPMRDWLGAWADTVLHHHERWDGGGYPQGLAGERICLGARIVAVADVYDVMTAVRSYKRPSSVAAARRELVDCAGSQFDPSVVRAFLCIPLPKLRWALGPLAWVSQIPGVRDVAYTGTGASVGAGQVAAAAPGAAGAAAAATGLMLASEVTPPEPAPPVVLAEAVDRTESGSSHVIVDRSPDELRSQDDVSAIPVRATTWVPAPAALHASDDRATAVHGTDEGSGARPSPEDDDVATPAPARRAPSPPSRSSDRGQEGGAADADEPRDPDRGETDPSEEGGGDLVVAAPLLADPTEKRDCFDDGWQRSGFSNQGQCVRYVQTGKDPREGS
jgi:hypothetical protein